MAAPYVKKYAGGFLDLPNQTTPVDSAFLNAVETALLHLLGEAPATDEVGVWSAAGGGALAYQKITNAQIDAAAAIDKSKLAALNIVDADIAGAAAIAASKLAGNIPASKLANYPTSVGKVLRGDGTWGALPGSFRATKSVTQTGIAAGTPTKITFPTENFDPEGWYDPATSRYTPLIPGWYRLFTVTGGVGAAMAAGIMVYSRVYKNGAFFDHFFGISTGKSDNGWIYNGYVDVLANGTTDFFEVYFSHGDAAARDISGSSSFSGGLVFPT